MSVIFPTALLSAPQRFKLQVIPEAEAERLLKLMKGTLPPGKDYASPFFSLSPQSRLGCETAAAQVFMRLRRTYGVNIYHSYDSLGYRTWHHVDARFSIAQAAFTTAHGKTALTRIDYTFSNQIPNVFVLEIPGVT